MSKQKKEIPNDLPPGYKPYYPNNNLSLTDFNKLSIAERDKIYRELNIAQKYCLDEVTLDESQKLPEDFKIILYNLQKEIEFNKSKGIDLKEFESRFSGESGVLMNPINQFSLKELSDFIGVYEFKYLKDDIKKFVYDSIKQRVGYVNNLRHKAEIEFKLTKAVSDFLVDGDKDSKESKESKDSKESDQ